MTPAVKITALSSSKSRVSFKIEHQIVRLTFDKYTTRVHAAARVTERLSLKSVAAGNPLRRLFFLPSILSKFRNSKHRDVNSGRAARWYVRFCRQKFIHCLQKYIYFHIYFHIFILYILNLSLQLSQIKTILKYGLF